MAFDVEDGWGVTDTEAFKEHEAAHERLIANQVPRAIKLKEELKSYPNKDSLIKKVCEDRPPEIFKDLRVTELEGAYDRLRDTLKTERTSFFTQTFTSVHSLLSPDFRRMAGLIIRRELFPRLNGVIQTYSLEDIQNDWKEFNERLNTPKIVEGVSAICGQYWQPARDSRRKVKKGGRFATYRFLNPVSYKIQVHKDSSGFMRGETIFEPLDVSRGVFENSVRVIRNGVNSYGLRQKHKSHNFTVDRLNHLIGVARENLIDTRNLIILEFIK